METDPTLAPKPDPARGSGELDDTMTDAGRSSSTPVVRAGGGLVGTRLAHFRVEALLGRGGMGEVYRATDEALDRAVAIKVLSRSIADNARLRERFFREARAQARIQHPNVCHIYYIGEEEGVLFFVMELIDGESVAELLAREGKLEPNRALEICRMAALGLREAQRHGFSHRDIKPSNLMVDRHGAVKVVDFGLVKHTGDAGGEPPKLPAASVEKTAIVGTPLYMAPEQARGESVDHRCDVYALGATLHHLVSGAPPFVGDTPMELVSKHSSGQRPRIVARKRRGGAPIDALCDRMMAKQPEQRFADYDQLLIAMENASALRTRPAGFLVRSFAFLIDVLVVALVLLPIDILDLSLPMTPLWLVATALYFTLCHGRYGRTLGKAALELEVVHIESNARPRYRTAALRFLVEWGPMFFFSGLGDIVTAIDGGGVVPTVIGVATGILLLLFYLYEAVVMAWLMPDKRTTWDRASATRVRYRRLSGTSPSP